MMCATPLAKRLLIGIVAVLLLLLPGLALAQIEYDTKDSHKQQRKRFLKEANASEAKYKDSHLNVDAYTFKVGEAGRKRTKKKDEREKYQFNDAGEPIKKKRLFSRKKKKKSN